MLFFVFMICYVSEMYLDKFRDIYDQEKEQFKKSSILYTYECKMSIFACYLTTKCCNDCLTFANLVSKVGRHLKGKSHKKASRDLQRFHSSHGYCTGEGSKYPPPPHKNRPE